jgi:hypothetical protein
VLLTRRADPCPAALSWTLSFGLLRDGTVRATVPSPPRLAYSMQGIDYGAGNGAGKRYSAEHRFGPERYAGGAR